MASWMTYFKTRLSYLFFLACDGGYYKSSDSSKPCEVCPANTQHSGPGALHCPCLEGFYRAATDPSSTPCSGEFFWLQRLQWGVKARPPPILYYSWIVHKICEVQIVFSPSISQSVTPSGPPSPPEDLKSTPRLTAGSVLLTWRPPANTGGRTDIVYNVVCERCNGVVCAPCGGRVHFEPTHTSLSQPEVTVSELEPHINYTFKVEALNGVSHLSPQKSTASITTVLHFTGINFSSF